MNDAESTPSPKRFCRKLGMRSAARNASPTSEFPKKWAVTRSRTRPAILLRKMPAATMTAAGRRRGPAIFPRKTPAAPKTAAVSPPVLAFASANAAPLAKRHRAPRKGDFTGRYAAALMATNQLRELLFQRADITDQVVDL